MWGIDEIKDYLKGNLKPSRYGHTLGVVNTAIKLAEIYGEDKNKAEIEVIKQKIDTVFTPSGDSILLVTEKKTFEKSLTMGLDTADVQVTTQGINTSLESLKMRLRLHQVNTQEVVEITKYVEKKKRIVIGPSATFGYDPLRKEWGCLIGVGVTLNF